MYPDLIPSNYTTVQSRLLKHWNPEQAFGFRYPPGFEEVELLIKEQGYNWGEIDGIRKIPDLIKDDKGNPTIMHEIKTVYISETDWCDAYKLKDRKTIKALFDKGICKTPEDILRHYNRDI